MLRPYDKPYFLTITICKRAIIQEQIHDGEIHTHHLNPRSRSDDHRLTNLRLLHDDCHGQLHKALSLDMMTKLAGEYVDYCNKDYLYQMVV
jgi:5-methylcytosine-specific restriction endonuclease McrA